MTGLLEKYQIILRKRNPSQENLFERFLTVQKMKCLVTTFAGTQISRGYETQSLVAVD
jgi:hypothetical protein